MLRFASESSVVQLWPAGVTYCRSSSQIGHAAGGLSLGAYCVPQVVQMKAGMAGGLFVACFIVSLRSRLCYYRLRR
jgi:hypothetical protein